MSTFTQILYHIVFSTKNRKPNASGLFIKEQRIFPEFDVWQIGYGGFTYSIGERDRLIDYVKNQKEHHKAVTFRDEYIALLNEHQIEFDDKYLL